MGPQRVGHDLVTEKQPKCRKGVMRRTLSLLQTFTIWDITQDLSLTKRRWQKVNLWKLVFLKELTNSSNIGIANIGVGDSETERWWTGSIGKDYRNGLLPWMPIVIVHFIWASLGKCLICFHVTSINRKLENPPAISWGLRINKARRYKICALGFWMITSAPGHIIRL